MLKNLKLKNLLIVTLFIFVTVVISSCKKHKDPEPKQSIGGKEIDAPSDLTDGITLQRDETRTKYTRLLDVPWESLLPGDVVYIKSGVYHEKIVLSAIGTADKYIRVVGVPGADGKLPIIDGENADSKSGQHPAAGTIYDLNSRSLICVGNRPDPNNNWGRQPKYISIENLEIRNTGREFKYKIDNGPLKSYDDFTAAIWVDRVEGFILKNCTIHDCGSGLFVNSKAQGEPNDASISKKLLISGNYFYNNGVVDSYLEHNTYVEAIDVIYEYNRYMALKKGAPGSTLKDRGAKTVIRYNYMESSARIIDLVESEAGSDIIAKDPGYKESYIYGNILYNGPEGATSPIHYGGDKYDYDTYRRGTLYFYNNTFVNHADQLSEPGRYYTILFQLPTLQETNGAAVEEIVDCRNNIFYNLPATAGKNPTEIYWLFTAGKLQLGKNWISAGAQDVRQSEGVTITGKDQLIVGSSGENPGITDMLTRDFNLTAASPVVNSAGPLASKPASLYPVLMQYKNHQSGVQRTVVGSSMDLGALEAGIK